MLEALLFLFTGIIGMVTMGLMITSYKSNQFFNIFLMLIFVITSIRFLIHGSYELGLQIQLNPRIGYISILYLAVVPLFYLYYKSLVHGEGTFNFNSLKHFIFIVALYLINVIPLIRDSFLFYYGLLTNVFMMTLFIGFYIWKIYNLLSINLWNKTHIEVNCTHYNLVKKWTIYLFTLNTLSVIGVLTSFYIESFLGMPLSGKYMAIGLLLFWLFIYFKILISPEILYGLPILNKKLLILNNMETDQVSTSIEVNNSWELEPSNQKNRQDLKLHENIKSNIIGYVKRVDELSSEQFVFRNSKISVGEVASKLGVPTSHIVYLFKYHSKMTFSEYRMNSRIQDAIHLMMDGFLKMNTLEALAYKTGFSSYNPFFSAFKKITGLSPQEYLKTKIGVGSINHIKKEV